MRGFFEGKIHAPDISAVGYGGFGGFLVGVMHGLKALVPSHVFGLRPKALRPHISWAGIRPMEPPLSAAPDILLQSVIGLTACVRQLVSSQTKRAQITRLRLA